jgi:serralysin
MATYYVATNGTASGAGTSAAPLRTIAQAMAKAVAGDTVLVKDGTYSETTKPNMVELKAGVTLKSVNKLGAKLRPPSYVYAIVNMADNTTIDGFDIGSDRPVVNGVKGDSLHNHGIFSNGEHHLRILNNRLFGGRESGCGFMKVDLVTIDGNEAFENAWWSWGSGISIYEPEAAPLNPGEAEPEFRIVFRNNVSHHNTREGVGDGSSFTDGNGIIIDDFQHWQNEPKVVYPHKWLVENNLCYLNGGKGIAAHWSNKGVMRRNTAVGNNRDNLNKTTWRGDLSQQDSSDNLWEGNLAVADRAPNAANTAIGFYGGNHRTTWRNNATFNGTVGQASTKVELSSDASGNLGPTAANGNNLGVDPKLVNYVPTAPGFETIGWRPAGVVTPPVEPPVEPPVPPVPTALEKRVAALEAKAAATQAQVAALSAEYGPRILALEAAVVALKADVEALGEMPIALGASIVSLKARLAQWADEEF